MTMPFELEIEIEFAVQVVVHLAELNPPYQKGNTRGVAAETQRSKPRDRNLESQAPRSAAASRSTVPQPPWRVAAG
jgi:hypothetical protein